MTTTPGPPTDASADAVAERIFATVLAGLESLSLYLGDRLGWYRALAEDGPATSAQLAARTATQERYAREWLEQQAVMGILLAHHQDGVRRYELPAGAAEALTDQTSLAYLGPLPRLLAAAGAHLPQLLDAYRHGGGVSWAQLGTDAREAQADLNRPWFERRLAETLHGLKDVDDVLARPGAHVVDIGCGAGWSTIALARAYPGAEILGVDLDTPSVALARHNAATAGMGDRVGFRVADAGSLGATSQRYDAAFAFECLHDMPRPIEVLAAVRDVLRPGGLVIVMDGAVADEFTAPGNDLERSMYAWSLLTCLPDGMSSAPSAATGTVMRRDTVQHYARQAGFRAVDVLPITDFGSWRFYRIR